MKGTALLLLCAVTLALAEQPQLTLSGKVCNCNPGQASNVCSQNGSDGELIAHENCNQFYKCFDGAAIPYFCPANLLYNPLAEICDWPENVNCGDRPTVVPPGTDGEDCSQEDNNNEGGGGTDDGNNGGTCNCNPEEAPAICSAEGSNGVLVAHQNCNQFYKCDHGVPVALYCPSGLSYNPYTEQCDWADKVDCGDRPIVEIEGGGNNGGDEDCDGNGNGNGESGSGDGNGDNGGTCNCNPGEAPAICAADGSEGVLVAHENCNQFYKCAHGVPVVLNCPPELLYNAYKEQCDWPHNVECGDRPIVEIEGGGNNGGDEDCDLGNGNGESDGGNGETGGGNGDNDGTCNCNPDEAPGICAADGSDGTLVAHENCNQFYKCAHGEPITYNCPPGLVYNAFIECCDWPDNVDCGDKPIVEVEGGGNGENGGDNGNGDGNGDNGTGGGGNGGNSNEDNGGTCNCNPEEAPGICSADGSDGTLVAHENCNQFYKCAHGSPVTVSCPYGLVYNPYIECCDWPANVDCDGKPIVEVEGGGNGDGDNGGGDNGGSDNGGGDNGGSDNGSGDNGDGDNGGSDGGGTCNCNPEEAPGICGADGSDGVLVAHENCNQFYKCAHGLPVALFCPGELLYDPKLQRCEWPASVDCGERPIVEGGGDNGGGDNGGGDNGGSDNGGSDNGGGDNGDGDNGGSDGGGTCNCNPEEAPGICGADGSEGVLIAHENCNQFYKCAHGLPVALFCPGELLYDPKLQRCEWPASVDCGERPIVEGGGDNGGGDNGGGDNGGGDNGGGNNGGSDNGGGDNGDGDNGGSDGGGTCNCNPEEAPGICGADGSEGVLIAHENCNQFYKCAHGLPVALFCPGELLYDPKLQRCEWPVSVDCGERPIVEGGGDNGGSDNGGVGNGGGDNGGDGNNGNNNADTCDPSQAPTICAASGSDGVLVAHENCNQFYKCAEGKPVTLDCPANLLYNSELQVCDWPENVQCADRVIPDPDVEDNNNGAEDNGGDNGGDNPSTGENGDPSEAPAICAASGSDGVLVAHENCNQFYKCSEGLPVALTCPGNLLYNYVLQVCDWPENVQCADRVIPDPDVEDNNNGGEDNGGDNGGDNPGSGGNGDPSEAPAICAIDGSNGVLIAHENCDQFYVCSYGSPVALDCPSNLLYNPAIGQCDWPRNVDCGDRIVPAPESGGEDGPCACNSREAPSICAGYGSNGKLIAHENCNQYYICFQGSPVSRSCPQGLFYEPHTERCLWPASVTCEGRVISTNALNKHSQSRRDFF